MPRTALATALLKDAAALPGYYAQLDRLADLLKQWVLEAPPNLGGPLVVQMSAGATQVAVKLAAGGVRQIVVEDDGAGIPRDELALGKP